MVKLSSSEHAEAVDENTVKVYLTAPYAALINGIASRVGMIFKKDYYEEVGVEGYLKNPIGTPHAGLCRQRQHNPLERFKITERSAPLRQVHRNQTDASTQIIALKTATGHDPLALHRQLPQSGYPQGCGLDLRAIFRPRDHAHHLQRRLSKPR